MCYRLGISLPVIVAGDNLNMPVLGESQPLSPVQQLAESALPLAGSWLQAVGAMFIRRSFGDDALYPVVVKEYIEQLLEEGTNLECFIECVIDVSTFSQSRISRRPFADFHGPQRWKV